MRKYLKDLKPTTINDLIAMNALYRPGPMQFIPDYIKRKHGVEKAEYDHELIKDILEPTFGIMIYQEQIMNVAQKWVVIHLAVRICSEERWVRKSMK